MKKRKIWTHLHHEERQTLHVMHSQGYSLRAIGKVLGRPAGTLCKELKRNKLRSHRVWSGMTPIEKSAAAHAIAKERARKCRQRERFGGILRETAFREWVVDKLSNEKWSPEIIANNLWRFRPGVKISTSTLYRFIKICWQELLKLLPRKGKKYRRHISDCRSPFRGGKSIAERPDINNIFGHNEIDTIVSSKHTTSILSSRERVSRYATLQRIPNLKAETVKHRLHAQIVNLGQDARVSWTHDNGTEFARLFELEKQAGIDTYRCDPYSSWQRGSVENLNGLVRRFFPKGTDFREVSDEQLQQIQEILNNRPMKCLRWRTPKEVFLELTA